MPSDSSTSNYEALEKQMAKDALEKALKDLHGEIIKEIEKNKKAFSEEIKKTLGNFKGNLEQNVAEEIERQLSTLFEKHFQNTNAQIKSSFREMLSPVLEKIKEEMKSLHTQGETTLQTWKEAVSLYTHFWVKPAFIWMFIAILTGTLSSLVLSYFIRASNERIILAQENTINWCNDYIKEHKFQEKKQLKTGAQINNNQTQSKKKTK